MKVYILDDLFWNCTTNYTGEEMQLYPVQLSILEVFKLKALGINYTTNANKACDWVKEREDDLSRDFGGIMVMSPRSSLKLDLDWEKIKNIKLEELQDSKQGKTL